MNGMKIVSEDTLQNAGLLPDKTTEESTGTTLVAMEYADGIIVGTDSRTSAGRYVTSRATDKITPVTEKIVVLRSGSAADTQHLTRKVSRDVYAESLLYLDVPMTVEKVTQMFRRYAYGKRIELSASLIVAGWDEDKGGQVYALVGGFVSRQHYVASGSGSSYITGYLDDKWVPDLSKQDAEKLVINAVAFSISRDGSSGGVIRVAYITKDRTQKRVIRPDKKEFPVIDRPIVQYSCLPEPEDLVDAGEEEMAESNLD